MDSVDVKGLRARFNNPTVSDTSSRDSGSPKSPRPGFGRAILPLTESDLAHRLSPTVPPPMAGPGLVRLPRAEPHLTPSPSRPPSFPRPPPSAGVRAPFQPADANKVKQTGEMLQNIMMRHQRPPGIKPVPGPGPTLAPAPTAAPSPSSPSPLRLQPRQRSAGDVVPLRKPLPAVGPLPLKPKRPPNVNLEPFLRKRNNVVSAGVPLPANRRMSSPAVISPPQPPQPPQRANKPSRLPRQIASVDIDDDDQDTYDDIASFEQNESCSEHSSQCMDGDDDDVYEFIDEDAIEGNRPPAEKPNKKDLKKQQEQEKKERAALQKKQNELKKNFQLQGEIEVLHTAKVRHDWHAEGKLDLSVRQGESVEILRVKNNPGGKWLARSLNGNYGYISNTCVDIDYEAVKRKVLQSKKLITSGLPPPPPDPPALINIEPNDRDSMNEDEDDYDDVEFPPPPVEISIDPKVEKELRKKFKYDGPLKVQHTMMVDPNCIIKKPGGKDLHVTQGEVVDVIQFIGSKKALCRNHHGKYGYVSKSILLQMEGDIYDDVDYPSDVYDNDSPH